MISNGHLFLVSRSETIRSLKFLSRADIQQPYQVNLENTIQGFLPQHKLTLVLVMDPTLHLTSCLVCFPKTNLFFKRKKITRPDLPSI